MNTTITIGDVQSWLREFNTPATCNDKKRELQVRLHNFQVNCADAWQICLHYLVTIHPSGSGGGAPPVDQFLWLFAVSTVEIAITRNWTTSMPLSDRLAVRNYLWHTYMNSAQTASKLERSKLAQLIALIGKREFPDHHPGFLNEVLELMRRNFFSGVVLLQAISAEVLNTKEDLTVDQKKYFQSSLTLCLPEVFDVINKAMAIIVCKQLKTDVSEIPVEFKDLRLLRALPDPAIQSPVNDAQYTRICVELMDCVQHLLSWVPLDDCLSEFLLNSLFLLAKWSSNSVELDVATAALTAISELFYRQVAIPHPHLIANGIMQLLQEEATIKTAPEQYQDKLTELLRLFTTQHSSRWLADDTFPNLLWHLYRFTVNSYGALAFTERLNIWLPIMKSLLGNGGGFKQYTDILMALLDVVLERIQFQNDHTEFLEMLDNIQLDDDLETEWQHFLTQCIEVMALIAEGRPEQVLEVVVNAWRVPFEVFFVVEKALINGDWRLSCLEEGPGGLGRRDDQAKCQYVHCILRDLSSLCQTFSRLAPLLEHCSDRISELVRAVAISLVLTVKFLATKKPYQKAVNGSGACFLFTDEIQADFVETFAQTLSALRGLLPWAFNLRIETHISSLVDVVAQLLIPHPSQSGGVVSSSSQREPPLVRLASGSLLLSITTVLRPQYFMECQNVKVLQHLGIELCAQAEEDRAAAVLVYKAICSALMLPWHGVAQTEQRYEERAKRLEEFLLLNVGSKFLNGCHAMVGGGGGSAKQGDSQHLVVMDQTLAVYREILDHFADATTTMKQMLVRPMKRVIEAVLEIFKLVPGLPGSAKNSIFGFLLSCIQAVQLQLGNSYIKDMLGVLLDATLASSGGLGATTTGGSSNSGQSVEKLLQILCLIVKSSQGSVQQVLLPPILELALDHIVPHLGNNEEGGKWAQETDITTAIFTLFDGILLNHWQYFYKGGVLRKMKQNGGILPTAGGAEDLQHQERFMAIMRLYGHALVAGNDPHIMGIVLRSLQKLDEQWKLYHKEVFQTHLLAQFQYALIGALVSPEGALCYDQMITTLYTMGQVNIKRLHEAFYMFGFSADNKMVQEICLATDLPTFSYQMAQLIQDTRLNASKGHSQHGPQHATSSPNKTI